MEWGKGGKNGVIKIFFDFILQAWGMQLYFHAGLLCNFMDLVNGWDAHLFHNYSGATNVEFEATTQSMLPSSTPGSNFVPTDPADSSQSNISSSEYNQYQRPICSSTCNDQCTLSNEHYPRYY